VVAFGAILSVPAAASTASSETVQVRISSSARSRLAVVVLESSMGDCSISLAAARPGSQSDARVNGGGGPVGSAHRHHPP
jgi:hypothetical protein